MDSLGQLARCSNPFHLSLLPHRPSLQTSISLRTASSPPLKFSGIRASSFDPLHQNHRNPSPSKSLQALTPILRTACVTLSAAAALFFVRFQLKPAIAAPVSAPLVEPANGSEEDTAALLEQERNLEEYLSAEPYDLDALRSLIEVKIRGKKLKEAIVVINRLIELEPAEDEWPLMKGNIYIHSGDIELAKQTFEEILQQDPLRVEAYHGLVMSSSDKGEELNGVVERIKAAMERCKKEKKKSEIRDFKLLLAQVKVIEGAYGEALKVYEELVKEEPRDFRPYLCQGIIYTLLRKKDEAEKKFNQYRKLVPKDHPYAEYFDDNMFATKFFAQKVERETAGTSS